VGEGTLRRKFARPYVVSAQKGMLITDFSK